MVWTKNVSNQTHNVNVTGATAFGSWLGHEGEDLTNGICVFLKETPESSLSLLHRACKERLAACNPGRGLSRTQTCWHPDLKLLASRSVRSHFFVFVYKPSSLPVYGNLLYSNLNWIKQPACCKSLTVFVQKHNKLFFLSYLMWTIGTNKSYDFPPFC